MADTRSPRDAEDWAARVREALDVGQPFVAFDLSREARATAPDDLHLVLLTALALMRCGALAEGRALVADHEARLGLFEATLERCTGPGGRIDLRQASRTTTLAPLLTEIYALSWLHLGRSDDLARARVVQLAVHLLTGDRIALASAAALTWHTGDATGAAEQARRALGNRGGDLLRPGSDHRALATVAVGALLADERELAREALSAAVAAAGHRHMQVAETRAELARLEAGGLEVDETIYALVAPPTLAVFTGQYLAAVEPDAERRLAEAIGKRVDELEVRIGYASAAAGPDLLFAEAMLERGAEVNLLLPFAEEDFLDLRVRPAGDLWVRRFRAALQRAASVNRVSESPYLGDDIVFRHANQVMDGTARLRARALATEPHLVAAWDYRAMSEPGGASDFIDHWGDPARLRIIDLDRIVGPPPERAPAKATASRPPLAGQSLAAMLFGDIVGFSRLSDLEVTGLWSLLADVRERIRPQHPAYSLIETWGDGLFVVMDTALGLADYAMALNEALAEIDAAAYGLPLRPQLRTGLHAGLVLTGEHPLTGKDMVYGSNVNRAARIEPISVPGKIYASQQFVALLTAEESAHRHEAALRGQDYEERYAVAYVGVHHLPKNFGDQAIYVVHRPDPGKPRRQEAPPQVPGLG